MPLAFKLSMQRTPISQPDSFLPFYLRARSVSELGPAHSAASFPRKKRQLEVNPVHSGRPLTPPLQSLHESPVSHHPLLAPSTHFLELRENCEDLGISAFQKAKKKKSGHPQGPPPTQSYFGWPYLAGRSLEPAPWPKCGQCWTLGWQPGRPVLQPQLWPWHGLS